MNSDITSMYNYYGIPPYCPTAQNMGVSPATIHLSQAYQQAMPVQEPAAMQPYYPVYQSFAPSYPAGAGCSGFAYPPAAPNTAYQTLPLQDNGMFVHQNSYMGTAVPQTSNMYMRTSQPDVPMWPTMPDADGDMHSAYVFQPSDTYETIGAVPPTLQDSSQTELIMEMTPPIGPPIMLGDIDELVGMEYIDDIEDIGDIDDIEDIDGIDEFDTQAEDGEGYRSKKRDINDILSKIERDNPAIIRTMMMYNIPYPIARRLVCRIIYLTLSCK